MRTRVGLVVSEAMVRAVGVSAVCLLLAGVGSSCDGNVAGEPDAGAAGAVGLGGSDGAPSGGGGGALDGSADADGPVGACAAEQAALIAFVKANKACTTDPDCVFVSAESGIQELCPSQYIQAGGFYLNASHAKAEFEKLATALDACLPPLLQCNLSPFPAVCWHGQCEGDLSGKTQCLSDLGGESACTKCACGPCASACRGLPERPVVLCALKAGCLGTPKCDPASPDFPCKEILAKSPGETYHYCNQCIADWQCAADCAAGK